MRPAGNGEEPVLPTEPQRAVQSTAKGRVRTDPGAASHQPAALWCSRHTIRFPLSSHLENLIFFMIRHRPGGCQAPPQNFLPAPLDCPPVSPPWESRRGLLRCGWHGGCAPCKAHAVRPKRTGPVPAPAAPSLEDTGRFVQIRRPRLSWIPFPDRAVLFFVSLLPDWDRP